MNITSAEDVVIMITVTGLILLFPLNIFLSIKLRKKRSDITETIIDSVPVRLKDKIRFAIDANMSWVFAACGLYLWFSYFLLRFGHHVTKTEFKTWHLATKQAFGRYFYLGLISIFGGNLAALGLLLIIPFYIYDK